MEINEISSIFFDPLLSIHKTQFHKSRFTLHSSLKQAISFWPKRSAESYLNCPLCVWRLINLKAPVPDPSKQLINGEDGVELWPRDALQQLIRYLVASRQMFTLMPHATWDPWKSAEITRNHFKSFEIFWIHGRRVVLWSAKTLQP